MVYWPTRLLRPVLHGGDEGTVTLQSLVPPVERGRELRTDERLIHRGVELDSWKAVREHAGVLGKERWEIRVLEIAGTPTAQGTIMMTSRTFD